MKSFTCTKKKPIPEAKAEKLVDKGDGVCRLHSVYHPDTVSTRHDAINQHGHVVGVYWKHRCPHCKEEWQSHGVVPLEKA